MGHKQVCICTNGLGKVITLESLLSCESFFEKHMHWMITPTADNKTVQQEETKGIRSAACTFVISLKHLYRGSNWLNFHGFVGNRHAILFA
jgi:hypothetical protein